MLCCFLTFFRMAIGIFILQMVQAWYILLNACSICTMKIPSTTVKIALSYIYVSYTYIYICTTSVCISLLLLIFQFHNLPCVSFRWWSSIPLVVRYVFRVRVHNKVIHIKVSFFFILTFTLFVKGGKVCEEI